MFHDFPILIHLDMGNFYFHKSMTLMGLSHIFHYLKHRQSHFFINIIFLFILISSFLFKTSKLIDTYGIEQILLLSQTMCYLQVYPLANLIYCIVYILSVISYNLFLRILHVHFSKASQILLYDSC